MSRYIITPWRTHADLLEVRQQLYRLDGVDSASQQKAVKRVAAWKMRGNLPHAIESTALLVEAMHHHNLSSNSIFSIRAVYSAAFCRFVTGFCDIGRHRERTLEASSMLDIAKQIDMPPEFVALRHEATHEELPGIARLVAATKEALEWLWRVYWSRLGEDYGAEIAPMSLQTVKDKASTTLWSFRRARRDALRQRNQTGVERGDKSMPTCQALVDLCEDSLPRIKVIAEVLVEERLIFPSNRELGSALEGAYLIWDPFLFEFMIRAPDFLNFLETSLLAHLTEPATIEPQRDVEKEATTMWILHVLEDLPNLQPEENFDSEVSRCAASIMKQCCLHPGYWTQRLGEALLERKDAGFRDDWQDLFRASSIHSVEGQAEVNTHDDGGSMPQSRVVEENGSRIESEDDEQLERGWRRAVGQVSAPIGVA